MKPKAVKPKAVKPKAAKSNVVKPKGGRAPAKKAAPPKVVARQKPVPKGKAKKPVRVVERSVVRIRDLDPYRKCGPGTSVERLIRVDEMVDKRLEAHLVFFDRHGWYCEHGQGCHAVRHARQHASHVERPVW